MPILGLGNYHFMGKVESRATTSREHSETTISTAATKTRVSQALHVLTLTPFYPSAGDEATGCFIAESLRELAHCGVVSTVVAAQPLHHTHKRSNETAPAKWVRYPQLPGNLGLSDAGRFLFARLLRSVKLLHKRHPIDLIHAHAALPCGNAAALLSRTLGIPFVVTIHGLDVFNACFQRGLTARWRREVSTKIYRQARRVICISEKVQKLLIDEMGNQVQSIVVYNGTDNLLFSPAEQSPNGGQTILIVGNLLRGKGHELVLKAVSNLKDRHPLLRCSIVGEGPDLARFQALATELAIDHQVEFLGRYGRAEVAAEMRDCAVFALPSRYEGLGCAYLEAMSCGKAVVACEGQGIDEIIRHGENGWLIPVDDLEALTVGLSTLLESPELNARIGQKARETIVDGLTLTHQAQCLAQVYGESIR